MSQKLRGQQAHLSCSLPTSQGLEHFQLSQMQLKKMSNKGMMEPINLLIGEGSF